MLSLRKEEKKIREQTKKDSALIGKFERKGNYKRGRKVTARRQTAGKMWFARKERKEKEEVTVRGKGK